MAEQPGRRIRQRGMRLGDRAQPGLERRGGLEVDGAGGDRRLGEVEVRVGEPWDRDLVRGEDQPLGPRSGGRLDRRRRPRRDDPAVRRSAIASTQPKPDRPARVAIRPSTMRSAAVIRATSDATARARQEAGQQSSPVRPAPRPAASAIRAFGAPSVPASIAPARTHVPPPPGKA